MPSLSLTFQGYDDAGLGPASVTSTVTSGQLIRISESVPASQTNLAVACAFTLAKLKAIYISFVNDDGSTGTSARLARRPWPSSRRLVPPIRPHSPVAYGGML